LLKILFFNELIDYGRRKEIQQGNLTLKLANEHTISTKGAVELEALMGQRKIKSRMFIVELWPILSFWDVNF
jgi:hypothetical protein